MVDTHSAAVIAYALMPNHFHLLVEILADTFSQTFGSVYLSYAKAINHQEHRSGPLFECPFRAKQIENSEAALLSLAHYIHRNPIKAGLVRHAQEWPYSSLQQLLADGHDVTTKGDFLLNLLSDVPIPLRKRAYQYYVENELPDGTRVD